SPGYDGVPQWFLRIAAPCLALPISFLFNISLALLTVPPQWKTSIITPVPKILNPACCADFRPISVTPILSRMLEKIIVRQFLYPVFDHPSYSYLFSDQFAFRPSGSTAAALIYILHKISTLLTSCPYVHLISLDFSKAFDTVRHSTLADKISALPLHDSVHNWLVDFLTDRLHSTKYKGSVSDILDINASIIQGSGIGPSAFIINNSDLKAANNGNDLGKYADDTYLMVPSTNSSTIPSELEHIANWAKNNNLVLNNAKTKEMIIRRNGKTTEMPEPFPNIERVEQLKILGVTFNSLLKFHPHISNNIKQASQSLYALKIIKAHGLMGTKLWDVSRSTVINSMLYASPAWRGFIDAASKSQLQAVISRMIKSKLLPADFPTIAHLINLADDKLFNAVVKSDSHVLHPLLPPKKENKYMLRPRRHNMEIPNYNNLMLKNCIPRLVAKDSY
ncbi:MAG: reverse transcriptase family protein, partial [Oscillospiraceae bacterium]